ncbi:STAS domain-containing protein [Sanguibacter antarcticus]|uniref:Anti-sigma factor antagonist n=1 Tax=Sanguibacter antarcticus TaxID=372484 RepID=A0A2A9E6B9_9MICO|nr:STAS domain-containing protein [Sanguibacter antarcticus]PFG34597.1 anti-anti-sigma factor [Sanguibacter antarcticus]
MTSTPTDRDDANGITCSVRPGTTLITLTGDIDAALREQASAAMVSLVGRDAPVVLDTRRVTFIDSSGIAFLVQVYKVCDESSLELVLLDPPVNLVDLLDMVGMRELFTIERSGAQESVAAGA